MPDVYRLISPTVKPAPILVSVPHCGVDFPEEVRPHYHSELCDPPDDTDFFVHRLYDFVTEMGISLIYARYSRWVIDLNRSPDHQALYNDGRILTGLTPTTDFRGRPIYRHPDVEPDAEEIARRKSRYFDPYYQQIEQWLQDARETYGHALLWDAHSIRHHVPTIQPEPFPDLILGDNDETSASPALIQTALDSLSAGPYEVAHNTPFKGGNITRHFGRPAAGIHALQLEMNKCLYMDDTETRFDTGRADVMKSLLRDTFTQIIEALAV